MANLRHDLFSAYKLALCQSSAVKQQWEREEGYCVWGLLASAAILQDMFLRTYMLRGSWTLAAASSSPVTDATRGETTIPLLDEPTKVSCGGRGERGEGREGSHTLTGGMGGGALIGLNQRLHDAG